MTFFCILENIRSSCVARYMEESNIEADEWLMLKKIIKVLM